MTDLTRRQALAGAAGLAVAGGARTGRTQSAPGINNGIRIGVLTDVGGTYSDNTGHGSITATRLAVEDFLKTDPGFGVEVVFADFQNSIDVGSTIARHWLDVDGVDLIVDVPSSPLALNVAGLVKDRDKVAIITGAGATDLTGKYCGPNHLHWVFDTWATGTATCEALMSRGGKTWYFVGADYSYGHALVDGIAAQLGRLGGTILGKTFAPFPGTTDFSSFLLQAQVSHANVIAFANAGSDMVNCLKQAAEFGLRQPPTQLAGLGLQIADVHAAGLEITQGMAVAETFYWDRTDGTRAFAKRFGAAMNGRMPGQIPAGDYSATWNYLQAVKAIGIAQAKASGRAIVEQIKRVPTSDPLFEPSKIRADGRMINPIYLFEIKTPAQSHSAWDLYAPLQSVPGDQAYRPLADGGCPMVRT
jgi:branched-chain amino acid transport system substrate-binding protein